jgi:hypothetical protein
MVAEVWKYLYFLGLSWLLIDKGGGMLTWVQRLLALLVVGVSEQVVSRLWASRLRLLGQGGGAPGKTPSSAY